MDPGKEYLIKIFLKKSRYNKIIQETIDFNFQLFRTTYSQISEEDFQKIKKKYIIDESIKRTTETINKHLNKKEVKELIKFFSSDLGQKISYSNLTTDLQITINNLLSEAENQLAIKNKKWKT